MWNISFGEYLHWLWAHSTIFAYILHDVKWISMIPAVRQDADRCLESICLRVCAWSLMWSYLVNETMFAKSTMYVMWHSMSTMHAMYKVYAVYTLYAVCTLHTLYTLRTFYSLDTLCTLYALYSVYTLCIHCTQCMLCRRCIHCADNVYICRQCIFVTVYTVCTM